MASLLYVAEYSELGRKYGIDFAAVRQPPIAQQVVTVTGVSAQSTTFNAATSLVRLSNDTGGPCTVLFGANPTATVTSGTRLSAGQSEYFIVDSSASKVAAISVTA